MTFTRAVTTNNYGPCKFIVDGTTTANGTHSTIAAALTSASSGDTIFIRPGTYTENLTLKAGVNLTAFDCDALTPNVTISGTCTFTAAGTVSISGIRLQTNSATFLAVTGSENSIVNLKNCYLNCTNNTGISYTSSGASSAIIIIDCKGDIGTTGITYFVATGAGTISVYNSSLGNSGASTTASSTSACVVSFEYCSLNVPLSTSSTGIIGFYHSNLLLATNTTCITTAGTGFASVHNSQLQSNTASALSIGAGTTMNLFNLILTSSNTNCITGAGTQNWDGLVYTSSQTSNVTTQVYFRASTWTPTIVPSGTAFTSIGYSTQIGSWTRFGNMVQVNGYITVNSLTVGSATGDATLPLPFIANASPAIVYVGTIRTDNITFAGKYLYTALSSGTGAAQIQMTSSAGAAANIPATSITNNTTVIFSICYRFA